MTSRLPALLLTLVACACALAQGPADHDVEAQIDAYLKPFVETRNFSGSVLIARRGNVLMAKSYGMANYELNVPNTPQTKFQIASLSKPFTAIAILQLEARGKLNLNDPLVRYIPEYPNGDKITIHHLLAHRSGIPNVNSLPEYEEKSRSQQTIGQIIVMFKDRPLEFQPGDRYSYSNSNYNLLAYIIQKVSGEEYGEYLRKNIFGPAGMKDTGQPRAGPLISNRASGYMPRGITDLENAPYIDWSIKTGNGSLYSTVEDLYRFDRALYTDQLLSRRSRDKMFTEQSEGVGYGWFVRKRFDRRVTAYGGRSPGFSSSLERYVDDDVCII
ncbi:MAG: beta-lactamase family protein, partial [Acidobacteria bacterium]|nr:beta-lactamase family protein [Acidobacteriota bacterium]